MSTPARVARRNYWLWLCLFNGKERRSAPVNLRDQTEAWLQGLLHQWSPNAGPDRGMVARTIAPVISQCRWEKSWLQRWSTGTARLPRERHLHGSESKMPLNHRAEHSKLTPCHISMVIEANGLLPGRQCAGGSVSLCPHQRGWHGETIYWRWLCQFNGKEHRSDPVHLRNQSEAWLQGVLHHWSPDAVGGRVDCKDDQLGQLDCPESGICRVCCQAVSVNDCRSYLHGHRTRLDRFCHTDSAKTVQ